MEFVGSDRRRILGTVLSLFERCASERFARMVVLEGHAGVGKTRIVQELFGRLAERQPEPAFWPPRLEESSHQTLAGRAQIVPGRFEWKPDAIPSFGWVGISCNLDDTTREPARALIPAVRATSVLHEPVAARMGRVRRVTVALWHLLVAYLVLATVIAGLVHFGGDTGEKIGILVGLIGAIVSVIFERKPIRELRTEWRRTERLGEAAVIDLAEWLNDASKDALKRAEDLLGELRRRKLPAVIVVDDAAWADADTVGFIDSLLRLPDAPVLVVATARPDPLERQIADHEGFGAVVTDFKQRTQRIRLEELPEDVLVQIVAERAPKTAPSVASAIARHAAGNPLVLGGLLEEPVIARSVVDDAFQLEDPDAVLATLPADYEGVFERYWERLPVEVRQLLAVASLHGLVVQPDSVRAGYDAAFSADAEPLIEQARHPYFWLRTIDEFLDRFADAALLPIVSRSTHRVATTADVEKARTRMILDVTTRRANTAEWEAISPDARRVLLRLHVLAAEQGLAPADVEAAWSAVELADLTDGPHEARAAAELAESALRWGASVPAIVTPARYIAARCHFESEHLDRAEELLTEELREREQTLGPRSRDTFKTRRLLAKIASLRGRYSEAAAALAALLADSERALGPNDPDNLSIRSSLTDATGAAGRTRESAKMNRALVHDAQRILGENHPRTLYAQHRAAGALYLRGQTEAARELVQSVLSAYEGELGPDHPLVLEVRGTLASMTDDPHDRVAAWQAVLSDRERILGADHPATLECREDVAVASSRAHPGRTLEFVAAVEALLRDRERVLGHRHPDTLSTKQKLAEALVDLGRADDAVSTFEELVRENAEVSGAQSHATFEARAGLAQALLQTGRISEGVTMQKAVLDERSRLVDPENQVALTDRHLYAAALEDAGRPYEAISILEELLADKERLHGPAHRFSLGSQSLLCSALHHAGRVSESRVMCEALLANRERLQGTDHPDTINARSMLSVALETLGRHAEAVALREQCAADLERVLGPDHPHTLTARTNLASCLHEAGRVEDALTLHSATLADFERVLEPDSIDALGARINLLSALHDAGRIDEAAELYPPLLSDHERILGADHRSTLTARSYFADCLASLGRFDEAQDMSKAVLADRLRLLGAEHPDTFASRHQFAAQLAKRGLAEQAITHCQALLSDLERGLRSDDELTLAVRHCMADALERAGQFEDARREYESLVADHTRRSGADDLHAFTAHYHYACAIGRMGHRAEAEAQLREVISDMTRVFGPDSGYVAKAQAGLSALLESPEPSTAEDP